MSFRHPWILAVAVCAAAVFAAILLLANRRRTAAAFEYSNVAFLIAAAQPRRWPSWAANAAWIGAVALVAMAFAGPTIKARVPVTGGAVVLCVDTSGSMAATDVAPTRAAAALSAVRAFVQSAPPASTIGIVSFASQAQEIAAPTRNRDDLDAALQTLPAPNGGTAIGDALSLAQRMLNSRKRGIVVLVTDGENNRGADPYEAARNLAAHRIALYTIGIGSNTGALIPGTLEQAGIDEQSLQSYAQLTGGAYGSTQNAVQLRQALGRLGRTTAFASGTLDLSLETAAAGALIMAVAYLWTRSI